MTAPTAEIRTALEQFVIHEARLLDQGRYDEWLALFADDGFYWIPAAPGQTDPWNEISIVHEDPSVLRMRVRRLAHPRMYAAEPAPRTARMLGGFTCTADADAGADYEVRATLFVAEYRAGDRRLWAGQSLHRLRRDGDGFRIVLKRIDLIDCDGVHGHLSVPL